MANIGIENIREVQLTVDRDERTFDSETIHPLVREMYLRKGFDRHPKDKAERDTFNTSIRQGNLSLKDALKDADKKPLFKGWNGLMSSCSSIQTEYTDQGNVVKVTIAPTRYLLREAMEAVWMTGSYSPEQTAAMSPDMVGTSLVVPVKVEGQYYILSQIKGDALGSGQIHTGLVAGGVDAKLLSGRDPLLASLRQETLEEMGINLNDLDHGSFVYMVDERETGQVNFAALAKNADYQFILQRYEADTKRRIAAGEKLEVSALANLPVYGIALVPLENGKLGIRNIQCFFPTEHGLERKIDDREIRPYTQATIDYLSKAENVRFMLEKAGF